MFQYTVIKDLCGGSVIKRRISDEFFLLFKECENIVIPLPTGIECLKEENLEKTFEILASKDFDHKRIFILRWGEKQLIFIYQRFADRIKEPQIRCAFLIC